MTRGRALAESEFTAAFAAAAARDARAVVHADASIAHGRVVRVIDLLRRAGVTRFVMQTP